MDHTHSRGRRGAVRCIKDKVGASFNQTKGSSTNQNSSAKLTRLVSFGETHYASGLELAFQSLELVFQSLEW